MTIAQQVFRVTRDLETSTARGEFLALGRLLAKHQGDAIAARDEAQGRGLSARVVEVLAKAAVSPIGLQESIAPYETMATAFSESLRSLSVFDAMLGNGMMEAPLRSRGVTVTTGITAGVTGESQIKIIGKLDLASALLEPRKAAGIIIISEELVRRGDPPQMRCSTAS